MQKNCLKLAGKSFLLLCAIVLSGNVIKAQSVYLPQSYQFNQKFNADVYSKGNSLHTSLRPFLIDSSLVNRYNQLMTVTTDSSHTSWVGRKLFNEHLLDVRTK